MAPSSPRTSTHSLSPRRAEILQVRPNAAVHEGVSPNHHRSADPIERRAAALRAAAEQQTAARIDRFFAALFLVQWIARSIALALTKRSGEASGDDLFAAVVLGAAIAVVPSALVVWRPGTVATMPITEAAAALEEAAASNANIAEKLHALTALCRRARAHSIAQAA